MNVGISYCVAYQICHQKIKESSKALEIFDRLQVAFDKGKVKDVNSQYDVMSPI